MNPNIIVIKPMPGNDIPSIVAVRRPGIYPGQAEGGRVIIG
jgi:hypothetical protein